ncbi:MAG: NrdH-redoxin [Betaproteobacteria bacterium]|nr:NrdH-redoxin [Betaproteobacteria bacterium]MDH4324881.1 NrdH-redoxin [Betaproteobacteria bacterium]
MLRALVLAIAFAAAAGSAPARAEATPQAVMYATSWCPYCAKARAYFARSGIAYVEHDIENSASANAEFKRLGGRGVPLIVVGREKLSGFSEQGFEDMLARAAR